MKNIYIAGLVTLFSTSFLHGCSRPQQYTETPPTIVNKIDDNCVPDKFQFLRLDIETFEGDKKKGWRSVSDEDGCKLTAAALLNEYRTILLAQQIDSLMWHEAQLRAAGGETKQAIFLFSQTRRSDGPNDTNVLYRDATIAFLKQDRKSLLLGRAKLAALPVPQKFANAVERFKQKYPDYPAPVWPPNLDVVDGFIACFDKPYKEAYKISCRP